MLGYFFIFIKIYIIIIIENEEKKKRNLLDPSKSFRKLLFLSKITGDRWHRL